MNLTTALVLPLLIGMIAGLRAMTAPAAVSWAARAGWLTLGGTPSRLPRLRVHAVDLHACSRSASSSPTSCRRRRAARCPIQFGTRIVIGRSVGRRHRGCAGGSWLRAWSPG